MAIFKAVVEPHYKRKDGTYNIKIRITHNRKKTYISTQWYVTKDDLRNNFEIKNRHYKDLVEDRIRDYRKICDGIPNVDVLPLVAIVDIIKTKQAGGFKLDMIEYLMSDYRALLATAKKNGKKGSATAESRKLVANSLCKYTKSPSLDVNALTTKFVEGYIEFLKGDNPKLTRKCEVYPNVISKALKELKYKHNDEENGIINIRVNPFEKIKQSRSGTPRKQLFEKPKQRMALSIEQIQNIIDLKTFGTPREELARDMFLLSFLLIGINSVDLYTCTKYHQGILTYNRQKVTDRREDDGEMQVKIEPEALPFIKKYKNTDKRKKEIFRFHNDYDNSQNFNKAINKGLKKLAENTLKIDKESFSYYSARRSWATITRNILKIDKYTVHEALNHIDRDMKVTDLYIDKDFSGIWDTNRAVINLFKW